MYGTYQRLHVHVCDSDLTVIKAFSRKMLRPEIRFTLTDKARRKALYKQMLSYHRGDQKIVATFRL